MKKDNIFSLLSQALFGKWSRIYVFQGEVFGKQIIEEKYEKLELGWRSCISEMITGVMV